MAERQKPPRMKTFNLVFTVEKHMVDSLDEAVRQAKDELDTQINKWLYEWAEATGREPDYTVTTTLQQLPDIGHRQTVSCERVVKILPRRSDHVTALHALTDD